LPCAATAAVATSVSHNVAVTTADGGATAARSRVRTSSSSRLCAVSFG